MIACVEELASETHFRRGRPKTILDVDKYSSDFDRETAVYLMILIEEKVAENIILVPNGLRATTVCIAKEQRHGKGNDRQTMHQ